MEIKEGIVFFLFFFIFVFIMFIRSLFYVNEKNIWIFDKKNPIYLSILLLGTLIVIVVLIKIGDIRINEIELSIRNVILLTKISSVPLFFIGATLFIDGINNFLTKKNKGHYKFFFGIVCLATSILIFTKI